MLSFFYVFFLSFFYVFFLSFFSISSVSSLSLFSIIIDSYSTFLVYILVLVIFTSYISSPSSDQLVIVLFSLFVACFFVFCIDSFFWLYVFYECSLIPIFYIIINWGSYPDRSLSAIILFIYTSVFSIPFLYVLYYIYFLNSTFSISLSSIISPVHYGLVSIVLVFLVFAVKLPVYGLHYWLPMAHVEAPTFGSMILAGVLLNLGGIGLIRFSGLISFSSLSFYILSYLLVFLVFSSLVCCFQSDFNRLVAYSSVSHMIAIPFLILCSTKFSFSSLVLLMFLHGASSPLLFLLVGLVYSIYSTRQFMLVRGMLLLSPLLSLIIVLAFFFTMSAPPFPSFLAELFFFISAYSLTPYFIFSALFFALLSLIYNLNWLSAILFYKPQPTSFSFHLSFSSFLTSFLYLIVAGSLLILLSLF